MKKALLSILILFSLSCFAQTDKSQFTVKATVQPEYDSGFGVKNPAISVGIRPEYQSAKRFLFLGEFNWRTSRKQDAGARGWDFDSGADAYYDHKGILIGGGFSQTYQHTPLYTKNVVWPEVSGGYLFKDGTRITGAYLLKSLDSRNGLQGGEVRIDVPLKGRLSLVYHAGFFRFHATDLPSAGHTGATVGGGLAICLSGCQK